MRQFDFWSNRGKSGACFLLASWGKSLFTAFNGTHVWLTKKLDYWVKISLQDHHRITTRRADRAPGRKIKLLLPFTHLQFMNQSATETEMLSVLKQCLTDWQIRLSFFCACGFFSFCLWICNLISSSGHFLSLSYFQNEQNYQNHGLQNCHWVDCCLSLQPQFLVIISERGSGEEIRCCFLSYTLGMVI